jgi:hypothetical protein
MYSIWDSCFFVPGLTQSACASWVQAWGSIGAILVAVWVARQGMRHGEALLERQRADRIIEAFAAPIAMVEACIAVAGECYARVLARETAEPVARCEQLTHELARPTQHLSRMADAFEAIPPQSVPGANGVELMLALRSALKEVSFCTAHVADSFLGSHTARDELFQDLGQNIARLRDLVADLKRDSVRMAQPLND